jgi:hypothetical protein
VIRLLVPGEIFVLPENFIVATCAWEEAMKMMNIKRSKKDFFIPC